MPALPTPHTESPFLLLLCSREGSQLWHPASYAGPRAQPTHLGSRLGFTFDERTDLGRVLRPSWASVSSPVKRGVGGTLFPRMVVAKIKRNEGSVNVLLPSPASQAHLSPPFLLPLPPILRDPGSLSPIRSACPEHLASHFPGCLLLRPSGGRCSLLEASLLCPR